MTYGRVDWHRLQERFEPPPPLTTRGILRLADMVGPTLERIAQCGRLPDPFAPIRLLGDDARLEIRVGLSILQKTVFLFTLYLCVSRACLGKHSGFTIQWHKQGPFPYLGALDWMDAIVAVVERGARGCGVVYVGFVRVDVVGYDRVVLPARLRQPDQVTHSANVRIDLVQRRVEGVMPASLPADQMHNDSLIVGPLTV